MAETKVTSIRADEETTARFKKLLEQSPNSSECLKGLINAYEMSQAKSVLTGQETNISDFQNHLDSIMKAYVNVLDLTANAENRIRDEFRASLESKDKIILDLQERLENAIQAVTIAEEGKQKTEFKAEEQRKEYENRIAVLTSRVEQAEQGKSKAEQYAQSARETSETQKSLIDNLKEKLNIADEKIAQVETLKKNLDLADQRVINAEKELNEYKHSSEIALERAELEKEKAVLSESKKATERIKTLVDETKQLYAEISELQKEVQMLKVEKVVNSTSKNLKK